MILTKMVVNFTAFAPLGTVLVAMLGIGIAEGSGLIGAVMRALVMASPKKLLTFVIVLRRCAQQYRERSRATCCSFPWPR